MNTFVSRRALLCGAGKVALSAGAIALLSGNEALAASKSAKSSDVAILNVALTLEHEAIAAYQIGAESACCRAVCWPWLLDFSRITRRIATPSPAPSPNWVAARSPRRQWMST